MNVIDTGLHGSDYLLDLTYQSSFKSLDERFVHAVANLLQAYNVQLYIGHFLNDSMPTLIAEYQISHDDDPNSFNKTILPIHLVSETTLSLMVDVEPNDEQALQLVQLIAVYVNQHEHLSRSNKDLLTGLRNKRCFQVEHQQLHVEEPAQNAKHVLGIVNVDAFGLVNDDFCRVIGDEMLVSLSNLMKSYFDRNDYLYRFEGDEFVVLLRNRTLAEASIALEGLRYEIESREFPQVGHLTVSIGCIVINWDIHHTLLFERVASALRLAKSAGGNNLKAYDSLIESGDLEEVNWPSGPVEIF